jgi:hypothetical protein
MASDLDTPVQRASFDTVVVQKQKLVETLTANRDAHRAIFEEALAGYKARSVELLEQHIERIKKGKVERIAVSLPVPEDHTDDYDRALTSLEWSIFDEVELSMREFDQYVRDNWSWKGEFTATTSMYNNR